MICWALSDDGAWRENTGFFDADHRPKPAADTLLHYTKVKWATNFDTVLNSTDELTFHAYYGDYEIEVTFGDTVKVFTVPFLEEHADSVFVLHESTASLKGPQLIDAQLMGHDTIILNFDKPLDEGSISKGDFKFFSNDEIGIEDIRIEPGQSSQLTMILTATVTPEDYISVSYFPGSLEGTDGSIVQAFGPEGIDNPEEEVDPEPESVESVPYGISIHVYPNPAKEILNIESGTAPYQLSLYNSLGAELLSGWSESSKFSLDVSSCANGIYFIKITDHNKHMGIRKIIINR
jgi:hypothetical protein